MLVRQVSSELATDAYGNAVGVQSHGTAPEKEGSSIFILHPPKKRHPVMLKFLLIPIAIFTVVSTPTFAGLAVALLLLGILAVLHLRNTVHRGLQDESEQEMG